MCLSQAGQILPLVPGKCVGSSRRSPRVQGCTPHCCLVSSACADGEEPQQGVMENCLSSLCEHKDTNILLGISIYILFVACWLGFFFQAALGNIFVLHWTQPS